MSNGTSPNLPSSTGAESSPNNGISRAARVRAFATSRSGRIVTAGLAIASLIFVWEEVLEDRLVAKRFGAVIPGKVYRSGQISKYMIEPTLKKYGIEVIVDLTNPNPADLHQQAELAAARKLGIEHHRFPLAGDGTGDVRNYAGAVAKIAECVRQGKPVLIHCSAGAQRAGGVCAAYRILVREDAPEVAYEEMEAFGWRPHRDLELMPYLNENLDTIGTLLADMGVIDEAPALGRDRDSILAN